MLVGDDDVLLADPPRCLIYVYFLNQILFFFISFYIIGVLVLLFSTSFLSVERNIIFHTMKKRKSLFILFTFSFIYYQPSMLLYSLLFARCLVTTKEQLEMMWSVENNEPAQQACRRITSLLKNSPQNREKTFL